MDESIILLTGFMGSGKSTVGRYLAEILEKPFFDLDKEILTRNSFPTISYIIKEKGEATFRQLELDTLSLLLDNMSSVISLGGGTLITNSQSDVENIKGKIRSHNTIVAYLETAFETCKSRIEIDINSKEGNSRPLFENIQKAERLYYQRLPLYEDIADIKVCTDNKLPKDIANEMVRLVRSSRI